MSKRDPSLLLEDINAAINKIERFIAGMSKEGFMADDKTIDAVVRNLEIKGSYPADSFFVQPLVDPVYSWKDRVERSPDRALQ